MLFVITFIINAIAEFYVRKIDEEIPGRMMNNKLLGRSIVIVSALAALIIISALVYILLDIYLGGRNYLTWEFLTSNPKEGMTAGGIFPCNRW